MHARESQFGLTTAPHLFVIGQGEGGEVGAGLRRGMGRCSKRAWYLFIYL